MFVFTEIENPDPQVTRLIEDIVRNQVIEMVRKHHAVHRAYRRSSSRAGSRSGGAPSTWRPRI